jgi:hypothetical protein
MPQFAVFFSDDDGFGIEMVQALDAAHARDITQPQQPSGRLSALPVQLLDVKDRHKRLVALLRVEGVSQVGRQQGSNQSSIRIQTHHSRATSTIAMASTARL